MNLAFIDEDENFCEILKELTKNYTDEWNIEYHKDVCGLDITKFDVIIANITDKRLIKHISTNKAEFALMTEDNTVFLDEEFVTDSNIGALIDKNDLEDIVEWIEYFDAKIKINKTIEDEIKKSCVTVNGYKLEIQKNIAIVEFQENILTPENRECLVNDLEQVNYNCILSFKNAANVSSLLLGQIIYFWNITKQHKGTLAIASIDKKLIEGFKVCSLNRLVTIFSTIKEAINFVEEKQIVTH